MAAVMVRVGDAPWAVGLLEVVSASTVLASTCVLGAAALALRGPAAAVATISSVGLTLAGSEVLKHVLVRPAWLDDAANSLPSGHVSAVAALAAAAWLVAPATLRPVLTVLGTAAVAATATATLALGWHRPSDALASVVLAVGLAVATARAADRGGQQPPQMPRSRRLAFVSALA
jgi:membrane-associated phospholipid phosphatase